MIFLGRLEHFLLMRPVTGCRLEEGLLENMKMRALLRRGGATRAMSFLSADSARQPVIVSAMRTPIGRYGGLLLPADSRTNSPANVNVDCVCVWSLFSTP